MVHVSFCSVISRKWLFHSVYKEKNNGSSYWFCASLMPHMLPYIILNCYKHNICMLLQSQLWTCLPNMKKQNLASTYHDLRFYVVQVTMYCCCFSRNNPSVLNLNKKNCFPSWKSNVLFLPETLLIFTFKLNIKHSFLNRNATWFSPWLVDTGFSYVKQAVMKHVEGSGTLEVPRRLDAPA